MAKKQKHTTRGLKPPKKHQSKSQAKIYWPYLPLFVLLIGGLFLNIWQPLQKNKTATLAYATEMSISGLLSGTNAQRASNGSAPLTINSKLNAAAQAKAVNMIANDYWSHNTPDGQEPWVFIDAQGYNYTKAGENLAYGFNDSNATIIGWMNSPTHRANLLDTAFVEVGFGFLNSPNYVGSGEETLVVAMYGKPYPATPAPIPPPVVQQTVSQPPAPSVQASETAVPPPIESQTPVPPETIKQDTLVVENKAINSDSPVPTEVKSERITLLQQLTNGKAAWSALAISGVGILLSIAWIFKHFLAVKKFVIEGETFVTHHPAFDLLVIIILAVAVYLSQSSGVIL